MSYRVLALKYRPQTFKDVIGQGHVTTTLSNAISGNRVVHAILFTGPRGTGKTTIARIMAKAMNCEEGPTPTPCNQCKSCTSITAGNSSDVYEIDGASNNSVDQIRELRSNVNYMPASSSYKIYIIDEVHMLSTAAFNALLKTLEEPPDHVIFIFATTESHKIPVTILSRCQRHDLGRITLEHISEHLLDLTRKEGYHLSRESTDLIASEADGSMRDALSLLDRIMSCSNEKTIDHETILENLGIIDKRIIFDLSRAVLDHDGPGIFNIIEHIHESGIDLKKFYAGLIKHFRNLTVVKICGSNTPGGDMSRHDKNFLTDLVSTCSQHYLTRLLHILLTEESLVKYASHTRTALEMVMLKLIQLERGLSIDELILKLDLLTKQLDVPSESSEFSIKSSPEQPDEVPYPITHNDHHIADETSTFQVVSHIKPNAENQQAVPEMPPSPPYDEKKKFVPQTNLNTWENDQSAPPQTPPPDWQGFIRKIGKTLPFVSAVLSKGNLKIISDDRIEFELHGAPFELSRMNAKKKIIEQLCLEYFGKNKNFVIIDCTSPVQSDNNTGVTPAKLKQEALNHPLVSHAVSLFEGNIIDIKLR